ncbi:hypothetical protein L1887_05828 [Cichorium endivia]|nr:hypothetical protein L1887_05828 [Cichorium endivia]
MILEERVKKAIHFPSRVECRQEDASFFQQTHTTFWYTVPQTTPLPKNTTAPFHLLTPLFLASSDSLLNDSVRDGNVKRSSGPLLGFFCATTKLMFGLDFGRSLISPEEVRVRILALEFGRSLISCLQVSRSSLFLEIEM